MEPEELFAFVFVLGMFSGVFIVFMGLRQRGQQLEMRHRERMAMIERGQIPDDGPRSVTHGRGFAPRANGRSSRALSLGIMVTGLGIALMTIIAVAGESPEVGFGVGGAVAILGIAFIVRSIVVRADGIGPQTTLPVETRDPGIE